MHDIVLLQVIVKNLSSGTRVVLKSHYGYEVTIMLEQFCNPSKYLLFEDSK